MDKKTEVLALVATLPQRPTLTRLAIRSMASQTRRVDALVVVSDNGPLPPEKEAELVRLMAGTPLHVLTNAGAPGPAGSWNTGIRFMTSRWSGNAYVAMLDDDDTWDADHVQTCLDHARANGWPDAVVSGLRTVKAGEELHRPAPMRLRAEDFLAGNPGWQGSNTFIRLSTLLDAGGFTEALASCNDRDLAVRVLSLPNVRVACTGRHTASWHLEARLPQVSQRRGTAKRDGLARFFQLHGHRMDTELRRRFFERAHALFGWDERDILAAMEQPGHA